MSEQSSEPERYTIDEMMGRLQGREASDKPDGELVTRADGTQAMKVRKRRRRTDQNAKSDTRKKQRMQVIQITGFVVLIVGVGLLAGVGLLYANSASFSKGLTGKTETASGAEVELKQFRMNPATANSNQILFSWPSGNMLQRMDLGGIVAKISPSSFLGKKFKGEEITAVRGELILQKPSPEGKVRFAKPAAGQIPLGFSRYSVPLLNIYFGGEKRSESMLEQTEASLFPGNVSGQSELRFNGGILKMENWQPLSLDRSYIKFANSNLEIKSMRFTIPKSSLRHNKDSGFIDFSGKIKPLDASATHVLAARLEEFPLSYVLGPELGRFFTGKVENKDTPDSNFLKLEPGSGNPVLELNVSNASDSRVDLNGFTFLSQLANDLKDNWFAVPSFDDEVSLSIRREGQLIEIRDIKLENRGKIAIRGQLECGKDGQIKGKLRVGLPATTISSASNPRLAMIFGEVRESYRWVDLEIGGTGANPADDLLDLYQSANPVREKNVEMRNDSFEELTAPE